MLKQLILSLLYLCSLVVSYQIVYCDQAGCGPLPEKIYKEAALNRSKSSMPIDQSPGEPWRIAVASVCGILLVTGAAVSLFILYRKRINDSDKVELGEITSNEPEEPKTLPTIQVEPEENQQEWKHFMSAVYKSGRDHQKEKYSPSEKTLQELPSLNEPSFHLQ
ncbi:unnamed protein product [Rhizopus stolonifer]